MAPSSSGNRRKQHHLLRGSVRCARKGNVESWFGGTICFLRLANYYRTQHVGEMDIWSGNQYCGYRTSTGICWSTTSEWSWGELNTRSSVNSIMYFLQEADWDVPSRKPPVDWPDQGIVEFKHFQVRYREGLDLVVRDVSCRIESGEKVWALRGSYRCVS